MPTTSDLSIVHGPTSPPLWSTTLTKVIDEQAEQYGDKTAVVVPWQSARLSYRDLAGRSKLIAKALLGSHLRSGDCVGIMAGNRHEYIDVFLGGARIGCPIVVLNSTCSPAQLESAVTRSRASILLCLFSSFLFFSFLHMI
jgi:acyl-CoA synthetase (AMP-forming)/AMP-acid ligase II